jgi:hypothetical protein
VDAVARRSRRDRRNGSAAALSTAAKIPTVA